MCTLILLRRRVEGYPTILLMNRDEAYNRPSQPPVVWKDGRSVLAPVDRQSGGTWIGVNDLGLLVAISNRHEGEFDSARRSRGLLCAEALGRASALETKDFLEEELAQMVYNPFNMVYADQGRAFVSHYAAELSTMELKRESHFLANMNADDQSQYRIRRASILLAAGDLSSLDSTISTLKTIAADHQAQDDESICLHRERAGTVSSSIIALSEEFPRNSRFFYSPGRPCDTEYEDYSSLLEEMVG